MLRVVFQELAAGNVTEDRIDMLTGKELIALAWLLGTGHSGGKSVVKNRILSAWSVRLQMAPFPKDDRAEIEPMVAAFRRHDLWFFCKSVKQWRSGNKRALAACLLQWRARCRQKGTSRQDEALLLAGWEPLQRMLQL